MSAAYFPGEIMEKAVMPVICHSLVDTFCCYVASLPLASLCCCLARMQAFWSRHKYKLLISTAGNSPGTVSLEQHYYILTLFSCLF